MSDGTERLCRLLYGRNEQPKDYLGGSNAKMLHDAADRIEWIARALEMLDQVDGVVHDWPDAAVNLLLSNIRDALTGRAV